MSSRRRFLGQSVLGVAALASAATGQPAAEFHGTCPVTRSLCLCGAWKFLTDSDDVGIKARWYSTENAEDNWQDVSVPHTWQIDPAYADYRGAAWYRRTVDALPEWRDAALRLQFDAVFHSATVWVNSQLVGEHSRKGYTSFSLDITSALRWGQPNLISVRVDNAFNDHMLPRGRSSDWAHDGGIYRPVRFLITPRTFVERIDVDAIPEPHNKQAAITISAHCRNTDHKAWTGSATCRIFDDDSGLMVATAKTARLTVEANASHVLTLNTALPTPRLWSFDSPHLYRAQLEIRSAEDGHQLETTFGVRKFGIVDGEFHLNREPVRLMGVERMAGSNPDFGMAEPAKWIEHDHNDLKLLNCVFTRVHWPQDQRVLDYCDRYGVLMQLEVPTWGPATFDKMGSQPVPEIMENGLEQLRELIQQNRNHPSVVAWGLCNEIGGQAPAAYQFARRMLEEAKRLDPSRLCSYASNSLGETPERDVAGLMDFIEVNEYFGTWQPGDAHDLDKHLDTLHATFPAKPIVLSEYGYCACTPDRPEGDQRRIDILRSHTEVFRSKSFVAGAIFFCYNDYRTHIGDRGVGALQQRVHGVVDVYGIQKSSYATLRDESSPIESLTVTNQSKIFRLSLKTRSTLPSYTLRGYTIQGVLYGQGNIPVELKVSKLPDLPPGTSQGVELVFTQPETPARARFTVLRPTRFPAYSVEWKP